MTDLKISVVICTHNPRIEYLYKVLDALKRQTLASALWEMILVDNASDTTLDEQVDLSWHPNARHIREPQLGLTHARLRGISESKCETIIFVDDDNVLAPNYLHTVSDISDRYPFLGAWGGSIIPEFECAPPDWTKPYWVNLAVRPASADRGSNIVTDWESTPIGAGLCIRREVANKYYQDTVGSSLAISLDRKGKHGLGSGGDNDIVEAAIDLGFGKGVFKDLMLTHLIPANRLEIGYLLKLAEHSAGTHAAIELKNRGVKIVAANGPRHVINMAKYLIRMNLIELRFYLATRRGIKTFWEQLNLHPK